MVNYYQILGIPISATQAEIKAAFKRLAMEYHPDRNPGNKEAEEKFKEINEAYHTLSDSLKKSRYDILMQFAKPIETDWELEQKRRFQVWQQAQQKRYTFNGEYFKIQGLAFLVFIVIAGFCFAILHSADYFMEQKRLAHARATTRSLQQIDTLFINGQLENAFIELRTLLKAEPREYRIGFFRDSLMHALRNMAHQSFRDKEYTNAVRYYQTLRDQEDPTRYETLFRIATCQYYLGNYNEALHDLKQLHDQQPDNFELAYQIAMIYLDKVDNPQEAKPYFVIGKQLFKENLTDIYGAAFEIIMNPADAPDIYAEMFKGRARCNTALKDYQEAITDYNWVVFLRPRETDAYIARAELKATLKRRTDACEDITKAKKMGAENTRLLELKYCR